MVRRRSTREEIQSVFFLKPGQTLSNTKPSERSLALIASRKAFDRFVDHVTETDKLAAQKEREAAKAAAIKKATYEMKKNWDNTIENITRRRKEDLLSRKKRDEESREKFVKEMTAKSSAQRTEIVKQARKLLLYRKPLCRKINSALIAAERLRELNAQIELEKTIKEMDKDREKEYADNLKKDVEQYKMERKEEEEKRQEKISKYRSELKKQYEDFNAEMKRQQNEELEAEREDQKNMTRDIERIKECEARQKHENKQRLRKLLLDEIEAKRQYHLELEHDEEFENRALEVYTRAKDRIHKMHKKMALDEKKMREQLAHYAGEEHETNDAKEEEIYQKAKKEKELIHIEREESRKEYEKEMRDAIKDYKQQYSLEQEQKLKEEKRIRDWDTIQRFKRDEFNKKVEEDEKELERKKKVEYRKILQEFQVDRDAECKREKLLEEHGKDMKPATDKVNQKILDYGEEVLKQSEGIRPLYPILKAITVCKKEMGLIGPRKIKGDEPKKRPKRRYGIKRVCACPVGNYQLCCSD